MRNLYYLFLSFFTFFGHAQKSEEMRIDSIFSQYSNETPGVSIAVVKNGKILFKKGYGMANLEYDIPISTETVFNIGSVSKQFVAFAIYLLKDDGELQLEDNIQKFIPEFPEYGEPITIYQLLTHTSGIRDQWGLLTLAGYRMDDVLFTEEIMELLKKQKDLNFQPGTNFSYSNSGYTLLAEIVERISGLNFSEFANQRIFEPLNMKNSQFYDDYEKLIKNRAYSYEKEEGSYKKRKLNSSTVGPTGLYTTVEDLSKWIANFNSPKVGNLDLIKEFNAIGKLNSGKPVIRSISRNDTVFHAKGQLHYSHQGVSVISHGGHDGAFRATLTRFPDQDFAVVALSNDEHYEMFGNLMGVAEVYIGDQFKYQNSPIQTSNEPKRSKSRSFEKLEAENINGIYYNDEVATFYTLTVKDDSLIMDHHRLGTIPLVQIDEHKFSGINTFPIELSLSPGDGKVNGFEISNFGIQSIEFKRLKDNKDSIPTVEIIDRQLDAYNSGNLNKFLDNYSEDIAIFNYPNKLSGRGKEFLKDIFTDLFQSSPNLRCEIQKRIIYGNKVIDHEKVFGFENGEPFEAIAIYELGSNGIEKVTFIRK